MKLQGKKVFQVRENTRLLISWQILNTLQEAQTLAFDHFMGEKDLLNVLI
jgi:hypothetical protein